MKKLQHVSTLIDVGGAPKKRKPDGTALPRAKRSRLRLHRTNVSKRVRRIGDGIQSLKAEYLAECLYVGLIIDEGNNFSRTCPLYVGVISCDAEYNWRIQYIGQADCQGKKTGEAIYQLVKKIFINAGLKDVWEKICSCGTDGASVMRSTADFSGNIANKYNNNAVIIYYY